MSLYIEAEQLTDYVHLIRTLKVDDVGWVTEATGTDVSVNYNENG